MLSIVFAVLLYDETIIRENMDNADIGISVGSGVVNSIRYTDDKAVVTNSHKEQKQLMDNLNTVTQKFGMKINVKKTKVMCISKDRKTNVKICIDGQMLEQVEQFRYLGSLISEDGYCDTGIMHIQNRTAITRKAFIDKKRLLTSKMNSELKKRIMKLTGVECGIICSRNVSDAEESEYSTVAFKMWIWQRMEKISWEDKISNE